MPEIVNWNDAESMAERYAKKSKPLTNALIASLRKINAMPANDFISHPNVHRLHKGGYSVPLGTNPNGSIGPKNNTRAVLLPSNKGDNGTMTLKLLAIVNHDGLARY